MTDPQTALVRRETRNNTFATALIAAALTWAIFGRQARIPVLPPTMGGIFGIVPGTFNFTLLVTLVLSLIMRRRLAVGRVSPRTTQRRGWIDGLPRNVLLRALCLAILTSCALIPLGYAVTWLGARMGAWPNVWPFLGLLVFYVLYFVIVSLVVTPIVVWRGLRD